MSTQYKWAENYSACRLQFSFPSLVKLMTITGFCVGIVFVPIMLLLGFDPAKVAEAGGWFVVAPLVILISPAIGALNGALTAVLSYPVYRSVSERTKGQIYTGIFVGLREEGDKS